MSARFLVASVAILAAATSAPGQDSLDGSADTTAPAWRRAGQTSERTAGPSAAGASATGRNTPSGGSSRAGDSPRGPLAKVSTGNGALPNTQGQVWREYDISAYTVRVTTTKRPEQAIVDWILRETGYEVWHSEPLGILSATPRTLRVYHTPEMQAVVADVVDRFISTQAETTAFSFRVVTVDHPNWRARAQRILRPVEVQRPGSSAWVLEKEDAAILLAELQRRSDYREHSSPHLLINNGQSTVVSATRGRSFVRAVALRSESWPGYEAQMAQIDEGFSLEFSPLLSADRRTIDATVKCDIDQVEKILPVMIDVATPAAPRGRTKIEVPQMTHFRFHERFRWPAGQVLLVGMGMVALPVPVDSQPLVPGLKLPLTSSSPPRADLLVFIEAKDRAGEGPHTPRTARGAGTTYHGRY